jgi:hypothetical protein
VNYTVQFRREAPFAELRRTLLDLRTVMEVKAAMR